MGRVKRITDIQGSREKGITLIALVITIVVLIILATISINAVFSENGIIKKAQEAGKKQEKAAENEERELDKAEEYINNIFNPKNGNWNEEKKVNSPKLVNGMTAVYWTGTPGNYVEHELTNKSTNEEWNNWYNYTSQTGKTDNGGTSQWANAKTKDGSYWVWIPRYEYKITSGEGTSNTGEITINFIKTDKTKPTSGYKIHPCFIDGKDNNYSNGEWDTEIPGIWVAKYVAGFQANSIDIAGNKINEKDTVAYSNLNYTSNHSSYIVNALGQDFSDAKYAEQKLSFPVFKPQTYAYNVISTGDGYRISKEIANATEFYGLNGVDSHQMKNSEWGAMVYLTHSQYGRNGTEVNINNINLDNKDSKNINAVTGFGANGVGEAESSSLTETTAYNGTTGVLASSTGNITGVYDISGCVWERTTAYITNNNENLAKYGSSYSNSTTSTKYATVYPYDTTSDNNTNNFNMYKQNATTRYGDAILETTSLGSGSNAWNKDYSSFPHTISPFFAHGGGYNFGYDAGEFYFSGADGAPSHCNGFRAVIID